MIINSHAFRSGWQLPPAVLLCCAAAAQAFAQTPVPPPVAAVVEGRFAVTVPAGTGTLPIAASQDWSRPLPAVRRVVIIVHGYNRNAVDYARTVEALVPDGEATLVLAPQFLAAEDIAAHALPDATLRWQRELWSSGSPAEGPAPLSAFDALDAILEKAADGTTLPNLSQIVLAGFSAGGQLVQRYVAVGRGAAVFRHGGIELRYVVGSPSSFAYFGAERPQAGGAAQCPQFDRWKYGFAGDLPPYAAAAARDGIPTLERRYLDRPAVYLVGEADKNPSHRFLDKSCAAEAQGPDRLSRTLGFFAIMQQRHGAGFRHRVWTIAGAAHNVERVFGSPCGRAVLFGNADCTGIADDGTGRR